MMKFQKRKERIVYKYTVYKNIEKMREKIRHFLRNGIGRNNFRKETPIIEAWTITASQSLGQKLKKKKKLCHIGSSGLKIDKPFLKKKYSRP